MKLLLVSAALAVAAAAQSVPRDGFELHYRTVGKGPLLVLLSGGPGFVVDYMSPVAAGLADSFTSVLLEQRGTGRSMPPAVNAATMTVRNQVADLEALRVALKQERLTLIGHSWGGMLAMAYAAAHPDHIDRLVLLGSGGMNMDFMSYFSHNTQMRRSASDLAATATAQEATGSIAGLVAAPAGAVVPLAQVIAVHTGCNAAYRSTTNAEGNYVLRTLPAGVYRLTIAATGFKRMIVNRVITRVNEVSRVDVALEVGAPTESVMVSDKMSVVDRIRADVPAYFYSRTKALAFAAQAPEGSFHPDTFKFLFADAHVHYDVRDALKGFDRPVLILQGLQDPIGESTAYETHLKLKNSSLRWIDECGHFSWVEQPEQFFKAVREFLVK